MKKKDFSYVIFASIASVAILGTSFVFVLLNLNKDLAINDYPTYNYDDYVNRSELKTYDETSGAQLYEAESATLSGNAQVSENIHASNQQIVTNLRTGSTLSFDVTSTKESKAKLVFSLSYVTKLSRDILASSLFTIAVNNENMNITSKVSTNYNSYDFSENAIGLIDLNRGLNHLEITSLTNIYNFDYMLLVSPKEKTSQENTIGYQKTSFASKERKQVFEAENQRDIEGGVILDEDSASNQRSVYFSSLGDTLTYHIIADEETDSSLYIQTKKGNGSFSYSLTVNEEEDFVSNGNEYYSEYQYGMIHLKKGRNDIVFENFGDEFYLDFISLNSDIHLSSEPAIIKLEAESLSLKGGCQVISSTNVPSKNIVGYNYPNSYVEYSFETLEEGDAYLGVNLSYPGSTMPLSDVLSVSLNGFSITMPSENLVTTGSYDVYKEIFLGSFHYAKGSNVLRITSIKGNYNLDYLSLTNIAFVSTNERVKLEAENTSLSNGITKTYSINASSNTYLSKMEPDSSIDIYVYSSATQSVSIQIALSYLTYWTVPLSNLFTLELNGNVIDLSSVPVSTRQSMTDFFALNIGNISLKEGLNHIELVNSGENYALDYFLFTH